MKKFIATLFISAVLSTQVMANKEVLAEKMLELAQVSKMMLPFLQGVEKQINSQFLIRANTDAKKAIVKKYTREILKSARAGLAWKKIRKPFIKLYTKTYSESELKELIAFYKSSIGKKMLKRMPKLSVDTSALAQSLIQKIMPKIQKIAKKMDKELKVK